MTKRERRYLFIICTLLAKVSYVIRDTNLFVDQLERDTNTKLETLLKKQVEVDGQVLACWEDNLDTVIKENEMTRLEIERLQRKLKVKKCGLREVSDAY